MPQGFFFYVGVAIKKDYNLGLLPVGYLENRLSSLIQVEDVEWDFIRNNQDISQHLKTLAFPIPSLLDCSAVNSVAQRCQASQGCSEEQDSAKNSAPELPSLIVRRGHFLFLPTSSHYFSKSWLMQYLKAVFWFCFFFFQLNLTRESKGHLCFFTIIVQRSFLKLMLH